jgi:histidyl-tRNA synthetase
MSFKAPRGTHDIFGSQAAGMRFIEFAAKEVFARYNFTEVRTPIFEDFGLFTRSIGETTDIVEKEMYVFEDRKGRKLALRPEGTASLVRAYIEHRLDVSHPSGKFFYSGEMFRYERPQAGRYRQFSQIGGEYYGTLSPTADAEIITVAAKILGLCGIGNIKIHINSLGCAECRPKFRQALIDYFSSAKDLCVDCNRRLEKNPLRLLDCKIDAHKFTNVPQMADYLCAPCKEHFTSVKGFLSSAQIDFVEDGKLVRGLDYYTRTVFEVRSGDVGAQEAIAAGGRYDNLVKELGGQNTPAVGFALGTERVWLAAQKAGLDERLGKTEIVYVASMSDALYNQAFAFANNLRLDNISPEIKALFNKKFAVEGPIISKNLTAQLKQADKLGAAKVVIFADDEFAKGNIIIKDMQTKEQKEYKL